MQQKCTNNISGSTLLPISRPDKGYFDRGVAIHRERSEDKVSSWDIPVIPFLRIFEFVNFGAGVWLVKLWGR
jgi:hypothetical protein